MQKQSEKTLSKVEVPLITTNQPKAREEFRDRSTTLKCPSCGKDISTQLEYHNGLLTYAACIGIFLFG
ncbi:uncharacterized protein DC041_0002199 [Schistosoma bovis]|uniref:LITAF domain-containing protein n=1 Tax=Schistosoma bovis TaxID=6184 RepID=A0A430QAP8_SCHBO|nr:uncharacterized protein DC041_0002199 [Schistosoma bovis]